MLPHWMKNKDLKDFEALLISAAQTGMKINAEVESHSTVLLFLCPSLARLHMNHIPTLSHTNLTPLPPPPSPLPTSQRCTHTLSPPAPPSFQSETGREKQAGAYSLLSPPRLFFSSRSPLSVLTPVLSFPSLFWLGGDTAVRPCPSLLTNRQIRKQSVNSERAKTELTSKWEN